jgi:hypothetical protein
MYMYEVKKNQVRVYYSLCIDGGDRCCLFIDSVKITFCVDRGYVGRVGDAS